MFVPTPPPASPLARELAYEIARFVRDYREIKPEVSDADVRHALTTANSMLVPASSQAAVILVLVGMLVAGVGVFAMTALGPGRGGQPNWVMLAAVVGLVVLAVAVFAIRRSSSR